MDADDSDCPGLHILVDGQIQDNSGYWAVEGYGPDAYAFNTSPEMAAWMQARPERWEELS